MAALNLPGQFIKSKANVVVPRQMENWNAEWNASVKTKTVGTGQWAVFDRHWIRSPELNSNSATNWMCDLVYYFNHVSLSFFIYRIPISWM